MGWLRRQAEPSGHPILVVDENITILDILSHLLVQEGHEVLTAMNVASALEVLSRENVDVLLSDIGLPDGTGYSLMKRAKLVQPLVGIALSGLGTVEDIARATDSGFAHHLIKPVDFNRLETVLVQFTSKEMFSRSDDTADQLEQVS